jgi:acetyl esterase/lipase
MPSVYPLWEGGAPGYDPAFGEPEPTLTPYLVERDTPGAAVVVFPGGGYMRKAPHEGEPIARWLNTLGLSAFVLDYRVNPYRHPVPLGDARQALRVVRRRAVEWQVDPGRIAILGFSAGGHLAATLATDADTEPEARPDAAILCYPVISFVARPHVGSLNALLGEAPDPALVTALSAENRVTAATPPTFLWHTAEDAAVAVEHSLRFASALGAHGVPFELHVFPQGHHGLGLAEDDPHAGAWKGLCATWLQSLGF